MFYIILYNVEDATDTFGNVTYKVGDVTDYWVTLIMSEMLQMISECYKSLIINLERWQEVSRDFLKGIELIANNIRFILDIIFHFSPYKLWIKNNI